MNLNRLKADFLFVIVIVVIEDEKSELGLSCKNKCHAYKVKKQLHAGRYEQGLKICH